MPLLPQKTPVHLFLNPSNSAQMHDWPTLDQNYESGTFPVNEIGKLWLFKSKVHIWNCLCYCEISSPVSGETEMGWTVIKRETSCSDRQSGATVEKMMGKMMGWENTIALGRPEGEDQPKPLQLRSGTSYLCQCLGNIKRMGNFYRYPGNRMRLC